MVKLTIPYGIIRISEVISKYLEIPAGCKHAEGRIMRTFNLTTIIASISGFAVVADRYIRIAAYGIGSLLNDFRISRSCVC